MEPSKKTESPVGQTAAEAGVKRARRSESYRGARAEYAGIRGLRKKNWIAAHIRERRYELELTQQQVAERAETSHTYISKLERGDHLPKLDVLRRIFAVLDEELLIGFEPLAGDAEGEREFGSVPGLVSA
jgi:DNA-binding XRE family transcriptional regulator